MPELDKKEAGKPSVQANLMDDVGVQAAAVVAQKQAKQVARKATIPTRPTIARSNSAPAADTGVKRRASESYCAQPLKQMKLPYKPSPGAAKPWSDGQCKASQTAFYCYATTRVKKRVFEDPYFRLMFPDGWSFIGRRDISGWVEAEHANFVIAVRHLVRLGYEEHHGNKFVVLSHDGVTLVSRRKHQSFSLTFCVRGIVWTIAIDFHAMPSNLDAEVAAAFDEAMLRVTGFTRAVLGIECISDGAALGVARAMDEDLPSTHCQMHSTAITQQAASGEKDHVRGCYAMEKFPAGKEVVASAHEMCLYFNTPKRRAACVPSAAATGCKREAAKCLACNTRISGTRGEFEDLVIREKACRHFFLGVEPNSGLGDDDDIDRLTWGTARWREVREFEAFLHRYGTLTTNSQIEQVLSGVYDTLFGRFAVAWLTEPLMVLKPEQNMLAPFAQLERVATPDDKLSPTVKRAKQRAVYKLQVDLVEKPMTPLNLLKIGIDPRARVSGLYSKGEMAAARAVLRDAYVEFALRASEHAAAAAVPTAGDPPASPAPAPAAPDDAAEDAETPGASFSFSFAAAAAEVQEPVTDVSDRQHYETEFDRVHKNFMAARFDPAVFRYIDGHRPSNPAQPNILTDGLRIDMVDWFRQLEEAKVDYGYLPRLATSVLAAPPASSFCERMNSAAKIILQAGCAQLGDQELHWLVVLRMNRSFMERFRLLFPGVISAACGNVQ